MCRAIDHSFGYQRTPHRRDGSDASAQTVSDISGAMRSGAKLGHGSQMALFARRQPIEPHPEKARVELRQSLDHRLPGIFPVNRRPVGQVPAVFAPFLQKIGIAQGLPENFRYRGVVKSDVRLRRLHAERGRGRIGVEAIHRDEFEQPLGVGFGATRLPDELRQSGSHHGNR